MSLIEEFTESEKQKLSWLKKLSANYPDVTETRLLARGYVTPEIEKVSIVKPSIFKRAGYFVASLATLIGWVGLLLSIGREPTPLGVYIVFLPFLLFASVSFLRRALLRKYNYTIRMDTSGLTIQGNCTPWGEIVETAIMRQLKSRGSDRFLVIFKRNGSVEKSDLFLFGISDQKLAAAVEFYKAEAVLAG